VPVSTISMLRSHAGVIYPVDALALSTGFVCFAAELATSRPNIAARRMIRSSTSPLCLF